MAEASTFMFRGLRFHIWEYEDRVWGSGDKRVRSRQKPGY